MSSRAREADLRAAAARLSAGEGLLLLVVAAYGFALLVHAASSVAPDTWLAVVGGREVAHGLPAADHLTVMASGRRWVDQQWLAQLLYFEAYRAGGMRAIVLASSLIAAGAAAGAVAVARSRGAGMRPTALVAGAAMFSYLLPAQVPRTQTLAYPLFVVLAWLLVSDSLRPSRRALLALPVLAVWTNLHGSVVLAACLASAHGVLALRRRRWIGGVLVGGAWLCVLASPYAAGLPAYYRSTILNPSFRLLTEWQPTTLTLLTAPFFLLALGAVYLLGRAGGRLTGTEKIMILVTGLAAFLALRNVVWFALVAVIVLPNALEGVLRPRAWSDRVNRVCAAAGAAMLAAAALVFALSSVASYPPAAAAAVASAAGQQGRVFATDSYGDWLLAVAPALEGRVAFDSRFELLSRQAVDQLALLRLRAIGWRVLARRYGVFVLDRTDDRRLVAALSGAGFVVGYRHGDLLVMARSRARGLRTPG